MKKGTHHTEATRRKISEARTVPAVQRDLAILQRLGKAQVFEFAGASECSEQAAKMRLKRLLEGGYAERWRPRGSSGYIYTARIEPGDLQILARRRHRDPTVAVQRKLEAGRLASDVFHGSEGDDPDAECVLR